MTPRHLTITTLAVCLLGALPAAAADLREGFAAALGLNADLRALEAQRLVATARGARADALLPGAPVVGAGVRSDVLFQDRGYLQVELNGGVPLWLPGQARALRAAAGTAGASLDAQAARQRLLLAGEVRRLWWDWTIAGAEQVAQRNRVAQAAALERDLARQVRAGQVAEADLLVATAAVREADAALRERQLAAREAAIAFRALTGLDPSDGPAETPSGDALRPADNDPRLAAARASVTAGRGAERLAVVQDRNSPELIGQVRPERDRRGEALSPNLLIAGRLPLRHGPTYREQLAEARAGVVTAEAELAAAERALQGGVDRAQAGLDAARDLQRIAEARHGTLARQARLFEESYRAGQLPLIEVVRVRGQLANADAARRRAAAEAGRAISDINQTLGVEPR